MNERTNIKTEVVYIFQKFRISVEPCISYKKTKKKIWARDAVLSLIRKLLTEVISIFLFRSS